MKDIIIYNIYIAWVIALCSSCNSPLSQALDEAGNNRSELEAVLEHYKNDELKLQGEVHYFTFEPHISVQGSKYGYKRENIYYFENGEIKEL